MPSSSDPYEPKDRNNGRIVWLDLEMFSLKDHRVLECAVILTTCNELKEVARKNWVIHATMKEIEDDVLGGAAGNFHQNNSQTNGLIEACLESTTSREAWKNELLHFLRSHWKPRSRLAGFSVHVDREVLRTQAPSVYKFLSHQVIDISSFDALQWGLPPLEDAARSEGYFQGKHRAMSDNEAAIAKLKWYQEWLRDRLKSSYFAEDVYDAFNQY